MRWLLSCDPFLPFLPTTQLPRNESHHNPKRLIIRKHTIRLNTWFIDFKKEKKNPENKTESMEKVQLEGKIEVLSTVYMIHHLFDRGRLCSFHIRQAESVGMIHWYRNKVLYKGERRGRKKKDAYHISIEKQIAKNSIAFESIDDSASAGWSQGCHNNSSEWLQ